MKKLLMMTALTFALSAPVFAAGAHDGGHDAAKPNDPSVMMIGMPGGSTKVDRTIDVTMSENDDGEMLFEPRTLEINTGETIRFNIVNGGENEHEFVIDTVEGNAEHKELMAKMDMEHDDPNSIRLDVGASGEVIWTFANAGTFEFACLIPGHYESGMFGPITVGERQAQAKVVLAAADVEYTTGKIKKINTKAGKVTIIHGPLVNLDMPAMTMVFRANETTIAKMSEGQDIEFVADRVKGKLTVTQMK